MSVSRNPFAALDEEYTPDAPTRVAQPKAAESAPKEIIAKQTTSKKRDPSRQTAGENRRGGDYIPRGEKSGKPRSAQNANEEFAKDKSIGHDANAANPVEETATREGGRGRGRGRGRGSGARREYDRRNASGKTDTAKATEQSWGNEAEAQQSATAEPVDDKDPAAWGAQGGDDAWQTQEVDTEVGTKADNAPVQGEDKTISYEEYLKQKAEKILNISSLSIRQANDGADDSKWVSQEIKRQSIKEEYFAGTQKGGKGSGSQRERKQKETLEIEQQFYQAPTTSRGRGSLLTPIVYQATNISGDGRGRGRGTRGSGRGRGAPPGESRGEPRQNYKGKPSASEGANLTLNDESAFPSLS